MCIFLTLNLRINTQDTQLCKAPLNMCFKVLESAECPWLSLKGASCQTGELSANNLVALGH